MAVIGILGTSAVVEGLAEDGVEWTDGTGAAITHAKPNDATAALFYIQDGALTKLKGGVRVFYTSTVGALAPFSIPAGTVTGGAVQSTTLAADAYDTATPANTPLDAAPTVLVGGSSKTLESHSLTGGTFALISAVTAQTVTVNFNYHFPDSYDSSTERAHVYSDSDSVGEFVAITEVASAGSKTTDAQSTIFVGEVFLSTDTLTPGVADGKVFVGDGDLVTVEYLDSSGGVISTDTITIDDVAATVENQVPADATVTNDTRPRVTFDVTDLGSGLSSSEISLYINGEKVEDATLAFSPINDGFGFLFAQSTEWTETVLGGGFNVKGEGFPFDIAVVATDKAGNMVTSTATITIDTTPPRLDSKPITGSAQNAIVATFHEVLDASSVDADGSDFTVEGANVSSATVNADDGSVVDLVLETNLPTDAKPQVTVTGEILDPAGNAVVIGDVTATNQANDGIEPGVTIDIGLALAVTADAVTVDVTTDEKVSKAKLVVTVWGPAGSPANQNLTMDFTTTLISDASVTIAATDVTGQFGVSVNATDASGNSFDNLEEIADEAFAVGATGSNTITVGNGPIGDADGDGDVDISDVTVTVTGFTATTTAIDASLRTITFTTDGADATEVLVDYSYVKADFVFEVDQTAPTVEFIPDGASDLPDRSPFIRVNFTDDTYPGDAFKAVSLGKADHTPPGGTATSILSSFVTRSDNTYSWTAQNLALGAHKLEVTGTDTAGNSVDATLEFTVKERTVDIALEQGWNLISIPDQAGPDDVNTVFSASEITTVLTYDPRVAGLWTFATRDTAEDTLIPTGGLTEIEASKGYWVESSAPITVTIKIPGITAGAQTLPPAFKLPAGWNLVAVNTPKLTDTVRDADEYFSGLDWSRAYWFNNATKTWESIVPDGDPNAGDAVEATKGYFVYLNKSGTLVP